MEKVRLSEDLEISRIIHGMMRLSSWGLSREALLSLIEETMDLGITTFDHADIYGSYTCEEGFGDALELKPSLRDKMQLITKCGIKLISENRPEHKIKYYDTSKEHIIKSVDRSLKNLRTDYIDLLLIHRPDPYMDPSQVAEAFNQLKQQGKVLNFGVSNFKPHQYDMLSSYVDVPLVTNQIELSPTNLENFDNGNIDACFKNRIAPMAWSPLGGGKVFRSEETQATKVRETLEKIAEEIGVDAIDKMVYAWLLNHPVNIIPIVGSGKIERLKSAVEALDIRLTRQQWFEVWQSSIGREVD